MKAEAALAKRVDVQRNVGHPWDGRPGFDILHLEADNESEIGALVKAAESKFWHPWIVGINQETGRPGGVMYKPCDENAQWEDSWNKPHPGNLRKP